MICHLETNSRYLSHGFQCLSLPFFSITGFPWEWINTSLKNIHKADPPFTATLSLSLTTAKANDPEGHGRPRIMNCSADDILRPETDALRVCFNSIPFYVWWGLLGIVMGNLLINFSSEKKYSQQRNCFEHGFGLDSPFLQGSRLTTLLSIPGPYWRQINTFLVLSQTCSPNTPWILARPSAMTKNKSPHTLVWQPFRYSKMVFMTSWCIFFLTALFFKKTTCDPWLSQSSCASVSLSFKLSSADENKEFQLQSYPLISYRTSIVPSFFVFPFWELGQLLFQ